MAPMDHGWRNERKREPPWGMGKGSVHRMVSNRGAIWSNPAVLGAFAPPQKRMQSGGTRARRRRCRRGAHESNPTLKLGVWASLAGIYKLRTSVCAGLKVDLGDLVLTLAYGCVRN